MRVETTTASYFASPPAGFNNGPDAAVLRRRRQPLDKGRDSAVRSPKPRALGTTPRAVS